MEYTNRIVRIGGRCNNENIQQFVIKNLRGYKKKYSKINKQIYQLCDKLNDFQLEPPHKPDKKDLSYYLKETKTLYENTFKEEKDFSLNTQKRKKKETEENYDDSDYEPNWVEAF